MARLLRDVDYSQQIKEENLQQILQDDFTILYEIEQAAQAEMSSYLTQRYIVEQIFTDTTVFNISATYYGKNLVEYTAPEFDMTINYISGTLVSYENKLYTKTNHSPSYAGVRPDDIDYWTYVCDDHQLFYVKLPQPEWNFNTKYTPGTVVWYNNNIYTALIENHCIEPGTNTATWQYNSTFSVIGILPTDTSTWQKGDNRNQLIKMYLIDCVLYHIHARINPRNIPDLRYVRYDGNAPNQLGGAIGWLKKIAAGSITADLPSIIPVQGISITWGSERKINNDF